ncbi:MAG: CoA transferase [Caulobacterales bacterium]
MSAFAGVRVVDCSQGLAGPMAAMLLADFGAEVLKVEQPQGDRAKDHPGYLAWNRNKHRLTLDLAIEADRARLEELLAGADLAVFDQSPRTIAALGLDADQVTQRHPHLVHLWTPPYGTTGDWSELPAAHAMLTGFSGSAFRQGSYADGPVWHVTPIIHYGQATMAAAAAAAALFERIRTGLGQAVTVSGLHGAAEASSPISIMGAPTLSGGHPLGGSAAYRLYPCGDGQWLFLGTLFSHFFERAVEALGAERLNATGAMELGGAIERVMMSGPRDQWLGLFREHEVPSAAVLDRRDWLDSQTIADNDMRAELEHPTLGTVVMPAVPAKLAVTPGAARHLMDEATPQRLAAFAEPRPRPPAPDAPPDLPLTGVKVLDLGTVIAGAFTGAILANFGAEVVKVESDRGDPFRPYGGFMNYNRGKRGLGLNLKHPQGRDVFIDMARNADVVVDNYRLGVRERLGIHYEALREVNPRIISCSINTYGSRGADAHLPGFDPLLQARSGMMAAQGGPHGEPIYHTIPVNDVATAAMASFAVIAALHARAITGEGQNVETSLAGQSAMFQSGEITTYPGAPEPPLGRRDNLGVAALQRYYRCADGWICIAATTPEHFGALAASLGQPDWTGRWDGAAALAEPRDGELAHALEAALRPLPRDAIAARLFDAGVPASPVFTGDQAMRQDWLWDNGFYAIAAHPAMGEVVSTRTYADFTRGQNGFSRLHPELGEHGVEVLRDFGIERERILQLARDGVIFRG